MAYQYMPKMFHDPTKTIRLPSYILNVRSLSSKIMSMLPDGDLSGTLKFWQDVNA